MVRTGTRGTGRPDTGAGGTAGDVERLSVGEQGELALTVCEDLTSPRPPGAGHQFGRVGDARKRGHNDGRKRPPRQIGWVISVEDWALVRPLVADGAPQRQVARDLGSDGRRSIRRWPQTGRRGTSGRRCGRRSRRSSRGCGRCQGASGHAGHSDRQAGRLDRVDHVVSRQRSGLRPEHRPRGAPPTRGANSTREARGSSR
jgi:hypothetical protein